MAENHDMKHEDFFYFKGPVFNITTDSTDITFNIARIFGNILKAGDIVCLDGDLGAGKTVFTAGIADSLGIKESVPSPTFTILIEHRDGKLPLFHFDVYRLSGEDEFYDLGFSEYFYENGICVIEWASKIKEAFEKDVIKILIERDFFNPGDLRKISFSFPEGDCRLEKLKSEVENYYADTCK